MTQAPNRPADPSLVEGDVRLLPSHLTVVLDGVVRRFHYVWLRDNSWASEDRVAQSSERKLFTAAIHEAVGTGLGRLRPGAGVGRALERRACVHLRTGLVAPSRLLRRAHATGPPVHADAVG